MHTRTTTYSLAQVEGMTGIPAEEVHNRIWKGLLPGDGNVAMPMNRRSGTVNAETMEMLAVEARSRQSAGNPEPPAQRYHTQAVPIQQVADELGLTVREVEGLLYKGQLEGPMLNRRYTGVTPQSLSTYRNRQEQASLVESVEAVLIPAELGSQETCASQGIRVRLLSLHNLKAVLTGRART